MAPANRRRVGLVGRQTGSLKLHILLLPLLLKEIGPNQSLMVQTPKKSATVYSRVKSVLSVMRKCVWRGSITIRMADKAKIRNRVAPGGSKNTIN